MPPRPHDALDFLQGMDETTFQASRLHQNAVIRSLEIIGEAASKVSAETRDANAAIPWSEIVAMRHRLIHGYAEVRLDVVWAVATQRLPQLLEVLRPLLPDEINPAPQ
jgi:uncharacterized protein with HEPN domain